MKKWIIRIINKIKVFFMGTEKNNNGISNIVESIKEHKLKEEFKNSNIEIIVTQQDIDNAISHGNHCPTALGINKMLKEGFKSYVDFNVIQIIDNDYKIIDDIKTPIEVSNFEKKYDDKDFVKQYNFILPRKEYFK